MVLEPLEKASLCMDEWVDRKSIMEVLSGNVDAYRDLVQRYQKPIFNLMYRLTGSREDARDLAQETFIKAYQKLDHFKLGSRFFPWLYTIGLNPERTPDPPFRKPRLRDH